MEDSKYIASYVSESDEDDLQPVKKTKRLKKRAHKWIKESVFKSKEEAVSTVLNEGAWSNHYTNKTCDGSKQYFRCNKSKYNGEQCDAGVYLHFCADSDDVVLFRTDANHTHEKNQSRSKITETLKREINELIELKLKPKAIIENLLSKGHQAPSMSQLRYYCNAYKTKKYGTSKISLGELEEWCTKFNAVPNSDDDAFIVNYMIKDEDEEISDEEDVENSCGSNFRIFISTKRLLRNSLLLKNLHADATYKLIWQGFPVLTVGMSDYDRHFHITGLAVCSNEKTSDFKFLFKSIKVGLQKIEQTPINPVVLVSDASDSIRNAFVDVFGEKELVMCWAHVYRNVAKKVSSMVNKDSQADMNEDIKILQLSQNKMIFKKASILFLKKWQEKEPVFIKYFQTEWLQTHENWFEGVRHFTPSTNNCLESFNRVIKDEETLRERLPLSRFKILALESVEKWSKEYERNLKVISFQPSITLEVWTKAYQWAKSDKQVLQEKEIDGFSFCMPSHDSKSVSLQEMETMKLMRYNTFDQFKDRAFRGWFVEVPNEMENWREGICNCPTFLKKFICKHLLGIAIRLKLCKPPLAAKTVPIGQKRERGRPKK